MDLTAPVLSVEDLQEGQELLVRVPAEASFGDLAGGHFQSREQTRGAVPDVVVRHSGGEAWADRQDRLCSIQRLNLRFLINAKHQGLFRRIQIEPDDVSHLAIKVRVRAELEGFYPMRLESMLLPDPVHRHVADLQLPRQTARTPVRRRFGRSHRHRHDPGLVCRRYSPRTATAMPRVQSRNPLGEEAPSPLAHGHLRDPKLLRHRPNTYSIGAGQDHPGSFGDLLRRRRSPHPTLQNPPITHRQMKLRSHVSHDTENHGCANAISVTEH